MTDHISSHHTSSTNLSSLFCIINYVPFHFLISINGILIRFKPEKMVISDTQCLQFEVWKLQDRPKMHATKSLVFYTIRRHVIGNKSKILFRQSDEERVQARIPP